MKQIGVFLLSPGCDPTTSQVTSPQFVRFPKQFAGTHLHSWVERGTVTVECLTQVPSQGSNQADRSGDDCTNPEVTAPPYHYLKLEFSSEDIFMLKKLGVGGVGVCKWTNNWILAQSLWPEKGIPPPQPAKKKRNIPYVRTEPMPFYITLFSGYNDQRR